jgi:hypothetical protein
MKKILILGIVITLLVGGYFLLAKPKNEKKEQEEITPTPENNEGKVLEFGVSNPLVMLYPRADGHAVNLEISKLTGITTVSYEMIYQTKTQQEGTLGTPIDLKPGETSLERELLFGTCSKNVCRYHEGVESGSLTVRFTKAGGIADEWRTDFKLQAPTEKKLTSPDKNFIIELTNPLSLFTITTPVSSLPSPIENKTIVGKPSAVFPSSPYKSKNIKLTIQVENPDSTMKVYGWDNDKAEWIEYQGEVDAENKTITAKVDRLTIFAVVK